MRILGSWAEFTDKVRNSERDRWQTYPEIAFLEEEHLVDCINCNNRFLRFEEKLAKTFKGLLITASQHGSPEQ